MRRGAGCGWRSAARLLVGGWRELLERQREHVAVGPEPLKRPRQVRLDGDALCAARGDDAEQDARAVRAFGAPREEHVEAQLGDVLELAFGGRVVDGDGGVIDESEQ